MHSQAIQTRNRGRQDVTNALREKRSAVRWNLLRYRAMTMAECALCHTPPSLGELYLEVEVQNVSPTYVGRDAKRAISGYFCKRHALEILDGYKRAIG